MTNGDWPLPIPRLSSSSIGSFYRCPEEFRRKYVKKERERTSASSVIGNAAHAVADRHYQAAIQQTPPITEHEAEEVYLAEFDRHIEKGGGPREIDWTIRVGRNAYTYSPGKCKDLGLPLAKLYVQTVKDVIEPLGSEEWFELNLPYCPVPIVGKIDLIEKRGKRDIKFGSSQRQKTEISWRIQGLLYSMVEETDHCQNGLKHMQFGWHTGTWGGPRSGPSIYLPEMLEDPADLLAPHPSIAPIIGEKLLRTTIAAMVSYWNLFGPDEVWPGALQHSWACDFCSYRHDCYWWHGPLAQMTFL